MIGKFQLSALRLDDGLRIQTEASDFAMELGFGHVSCLNIGRPGWCYFSAHDANWVAAIRLTYGDNSGGVAFFDSTYELWSYHRSTHSFYEAEPKVSVSPSGRQLIYTSDQYGQVIPTDIIVSPLGVDGAGE